MKSICHGLERVLEFAGGVVLLVAASPFLLLVTVLVLIDQTGPVIYYQELYGKDKRVFSIYKFRTMRSGSEPGRPVWGKEVDPRASRIGNFLRRTHIDELPQLLNVIKGDMNLIGPRPERPYFADLFEEVIPEYASRFSVKPGITGWAQVHGLRGDSCVEQRTEYDLFYMRNRSAALDIYVLCMTPFARPVQCQTRAFSQKGAEIPGSRALSTPIRKA